jgi:hypothetical protein
MKQATSASMRRLADRVQRQFPETVAHQHLRDAARALDSGRTEGASRHLNAAINTFTPQNLHRHGIQDDEGYTAGKSFMHEAHRHLLLVKDIEDVGAQNRQIMDGRREQILSDAQAKAMKNAQPQPVGRPDGAAQGPASPQPVGSRQFTTWEDVSRAIELVGPKGFIHGWIKSGGGGQKPLLGSEGDPANAAKARKAGDNLSVASDFSPEDRQAAKDHAYAAAAHLEAGRYAEADRELQAVHDIAMRNSTGSAGVVDHIRKKIAKSEAKRPDAGKIAGLEKSIYGHTFPNPDAPGSTITASWGPVLDAIELVGPKGYEHGWKYVGGGGVPSPFGKHLSHKEAQGFAEVFSSGQGSWKEARTGLSPAQRQVYDKARGKGKSHMGSLLAAQNMLSIQFSSAWDGALAAIELSAQTGALSTTPHPLGKKGLWGVDGMQLPPYIQNIARALMRKRGMDESRAIAIARAATRKWRAGGGKVHPEVRAASQKTSAEWDEKRARAHAHAWDGALAAIELVGPKGYSHGWIKSPDSSLVSVQQMSPGQRRVYAKARATGSSHGRALQIVQRAFTHEVDSVYASAATATRNPAVQKMNLVQREEFVRQTARGVPVATAMRIARGATTPWGAATNIQATNWETVSNEIALATEILLYAPGQARNPAGPGGGQWASGQQGGASGSGGGNSKAQKKAALLRQAAQLRARAAIMGKQLSVLRAALASATGKTSKGQKGATTTAKAATTKATGTTAAKTGAAATAAAATTAANKAATTSAAGVAAVAKTTAAAKSMSVGQLQSQIKALSAQRSALLKQAVALTLQASKL